MTQTPTIAIKAILSHLPQTQAIYLFGSWGSEHQNSLSDIDIGILLPVIHTVSRSIQSQLQTDISTQLNCEHADIIDLRSTDTVMQMQIIESGQLIYSDNSSAASEFEMLTLSKYQKLNNERQHIINSALLSGRLL